MLLKTTKLKKKLKITKSQKRRIHAEGLGGWGVGSKEPTQTCFFYYSVTKLN